MKPGDAVPELRVMPDRHLPHRFAGAGEDFNPIHIDPEAARQAGLPGHVLHGLYLMSVVARAAGELAPGDPRALKRLSVEFRDMGVPEQEIIVTGTVREVRDGRAVMDAAAEQSGKVIVGGGEAEIEV
ncbi:MAG: hypothetical protein H0V55_02605 [Thermoleophilaceae bacterium]|jgi:acyl dehydratase|nr:hypothetical protein [Thermoleophilaceae bacterium]MBA3840936.1 hypothetical protein [Thermoleophilaceae bacterium]